jgi:transposase
MSKDQTSVTAVAQEGERRQYSEAERRRIVEETYVPGASVSVVARRHDVNANLVFKWRQRYGRQDEPAGFLPVVATPEPAPAVAAAAPAEPSPRRRRPRKATSDTGFIEIEFSGGHRVRVHGAADARTVRSVIDALSR